MKKIVKTCLLGLLVMASAFSCAVDDDNSKEEDYTETIFGKKMDMVYVEGGTFLIGDVDEYSEEKSGRIITLDSYYIGKFEVTQRQWYTVMRTKPSYFNGCDNCPVEYVSWNDAQEFCRKISAYTGKEYTLPTEAQWEYAAKGGKKSQGYKYSGSDDIDQVAWYLNNSNGKTHPVGTKRANELGIYDMSGNVWEWCSDIDECGLYRALRGGSFIDNDDCSVSKRSEFSPVNCSYLIGFRVVCRFKEI